MEIFRIICAVHNLCDLCTTHCVCLSGLGVLGEEASKSAVMLKDTQKLKRCASYLQDMPSGRGKWDDIMNIENS